MKVIFKCGKCGHKYTVDTEQISIGKFGRYCPNCDAYMPDDVKSFAQSLVTMKNHPNSSGWEIFNLPDEFSKATVTLTLHQE